LTLFTVTVNDFASDSCEVVSVTRTVIVAELGPSAGVYCNTPLFALMVAPAGAPGSRL